jgi:hypothetical protein
VTVPLLLWGYELLRGGAPERTSLALRNARHLVHVERTLGIYDEASWQRLVGHAPWLAHGAAEAYVPLHAAASVATLVWLLARHPARYAFIRSSMVFATAIALVMYVALPTAPPRLIGGFVDSVSTSSTFNLNSHMMGQLYNPIAAFPSMHAGYSLFVAVACLQSSRRLVRAVGILYPMVICSIIVVTANHYFLDIAGGFAVAALGMSIAKVLRAPTGVAPRAELQVVPTLAPEPAQEGAA